MSKVLVIDDSISACVAIERMLGSQGFDVVWELDAATALQTVEKHQPDLVICDLVLPDISGFDVCQSLHENPLLDKLPVLLISGNVDDEVRKKAQECDAAGIIAKPFTPGQLLEEIQSTLAAIESPSSQVTPSDLSPALMRTVAAELELFRQLDYRVACVLGSDGKIIATGGRTVPQTATQNLQRELSALRHLAIEATDLAHDTSEEIRLTLEKSSGTCLVESLGGGYLLIVILGESNTLGIARYLTNKIHQPLKKILS